jgi:hypothetical protein
MGSAKLKVSIPLKLIPLEQDGFHLMLKVKVNNKIARLILDTGASKTVFDKNKIERYVGHDQFEKNEHMSTGLGTDSMESHMVDIKKFSLGDLMIKNIKLVLLDLRHISQTYELMGLPAIDGVLGGDILKKYNAVIDYKEPAVLLMKLPEIISLSKVKRKLKKNSKSK